MSRSADEFYALRDQRSAQILEADLAPIVETPVCILVGQDAAETREGQVCVLALVNMLARLHRRLRVVVPDTDLIARGLRSDDSGLPDAVEQLATAIDPFIEIRVERRLDTAMVDGAITVGIGAGSPRGLQLYLSADRAVALVTPRSESFSPDASSVLGAGMAACLGARVILGCALGQPVGYARISIWNFDQGEAADPGPADLDPLDVGTTAVIGAGAVGSALAYWVAEIGHLGDWELVDKDITELHNTNRCMTLTAAHAGWPNGSPLPKARPAARLIGGEAVERWYDDWLTLRAADGTEPDLVLVLANEHGVRHLAGCRYEPILLHASTSSQWTAELHRQIAGLDDCIGCRFGDLDVPALACSEGRLDVPDQDGGDGFTTSARSADAALPFLSGCAGLMLASALRQLELGLIRDHRHNHWQLLLKSPQPSWVCRRRRCEPDCGMRLPREALDELMRGRRWASVT
jgi:hypothetical protein